MTSVVHKPAKTSHILHAACASGAPLSPRHALLLKSLPPHMFQDVIIHMVQYGTHPGVCVLLATRKPTAPDIQRVLDNAQETFIQQSKAPSTLRPEKKLRLLKVFSSCPIDHPLTPLLLMNWPIDGRPDNEQPSLPALSDILKAIPRSQFDPSEAWSDFLATLVNRQAYDLIQAAPWNEVWSSFYRSPLAATLERHLTKDTPNPKTEQLLKTLQDINPATVEDLINLHVEIYDVWSSVKKTQILWEAVDNWWPSVRLEVRDKVLSWYNSWGRDNHLPAGLRALTEKEALASTIEANRQTPSSIKRM